ncbi:2-amino-4-hydroxy-6-hydroxymethyldihydropteridine diphosphokinase [Brevibacterium casei]|uniref:Bifunctional folate synthesis protein n=1 Tax=Brevibacterium casei TaxID=33889 RepID=A0A7T2TJZ8_9MICO|nr:2-amino-4-hydroxy-6-hydroxymethyldihydropteridine diphosphokinase [Brevibacterium casei]MCT1446766.1 2-amino-4-hydroxy-6-hydroxymethyldihydropteridine diphosphokinase [Brevibacterium casei]MCT1766143.1 2-amino-4-hydroxy-6-hydroxymethyldihydropteridine diphosphokinase [Brevibacterium casei]QPS35244.1 2-amino-4-hydroxy-6-hydroxymethyldihydropteridine diphosphokinase [Brevibacterium casei]SII19989.1 dihydroneopterin aldolase [Mycobacteroides abscessus subsp. abscessus]
MSGLPDRIALRGLTVRGNHGVFDFEKRDGQDFVIDVTLHASTAAAAATDDIADTIHYGELAEDVARIVEDNTFDLIETLAEAIAAHCLTLTERVEVVVHKPSAPIERTFADVTVTVDRSRETAARADGSDPASASAYLSLGANLGEAATTLDEAVAALDRHPRISVASRSSLYRTAPWGGVEQNDFLNLGVIVETTLPPRELLAVCQGIEVACGRTRELRWGPRTLDIDVIAYTVRGVDVVLDSAALTLPHPRAHERAFVLVPWAEIAPDTVVDSPTGPRPIAEAIASLDDQGIERADA